MIDRKNLRLILINVMFVAALIVVVFPLLLISKYNYPSADDWSFGTMGYHALKNGEGAFGVIRASFATVKDHYAHWEGRFSATFLASLQPGMWGEKYYRIVAWLMIGGLIASELYLCRSLLKRYAKESAGGVERCNYRTLINSADFIYACTGRKFLLVYWCS